MLIFDEIDQLIDSFFSAKKSASREAIIILNVITYLFQGIMPEV